MINAGAGTNLDAEIYGFNNEILNIKYIADATGVTTWNNSSTNAQSFAIGLDTLTVDLTAYTIAGASSLILADYQAGTLFGDSYSSITVTDGGTTLVNGVDYNLDYLTDTNITLNLIPEPGTYALIGGMLALGYVMVRRRQD